MISLATPIGELEKQLLSLSLVDRLRIIQSVIQSLMLEVTSQTAQSSVSPPDDQKNQEGSITLQSALPHLDRNLGVGLGWSEGFFAETIGALADDDSFVRQPQ